MIKIKAFVLLLPVEQSEIILKNEQYKDLKQYKDLLKAIFDVKKVKTVEEMVKKLKCTISVLTKWVKILRVLLNTSSYLEA